MPDERQATRVVTQEKIVELRKLRNEIRAASIYELVLMLFTREVFVAGTWQVYVVLDAIKRELSDADFCVFATLSHHFEKSTLLEITAVDCFNTFCDEKSLSNLVAWYKQTYDMEDFSWINYQLFVEISRRVEAVTSSAETAIWFDDLVREIVTAKDGHEPLIALFCAKYIELAEESDRASRDPC